MAQTRLGACLKRQEQEWAPLRSRPRSRRPLFAWVLAYMALLIACGSSSPDPTAIPFEDWGTEVAALECGMIFDCCNSTQATALGYADKAECLQVIASAVQTGLEQNVSSGYATYDEHAARTCLDKSAAVSCLEFFSPYGRPALLGSACAKVETGRGKLGDPCGDLDFSCESDNCESDHCAAPRGCSVPCGLGQYCDATTGGCLPQKTVGASCADDTECNRPLVCPSGSCGMPLTDGSACSYNSDCISGSCDPGGTTQTCGPPLPDGAACTSSSGCASGGCTAVGGGAPICGPPFCDGV
jgi:hypothetical protein